MLNLHIGRRPREIQMPETWDELSQDQLCLLARNLFDKVDPVELQVSIVVILTGIKPWELKHISAPVMHEELIPLISWTLESCTLTRQLIPVIRTYRYRNFYGPSSELMNLRFSEFDSAEKELYEFTEDPGNIDKLYRFIACLYRPGKVFFSGTDEYGDRRNPFDQGKVSRHAAILMKILPLEKAHAILLWYRGCRQKIFEDFRELFSSSEGGESTYPDYFPLMRMIAKEHIYGDIDKVEQLYLYNALHEMYCALEERRRNEANTKNTQ